MKFSAVMILMLGIMIPELYATEINIYSERKEELIQPLLKKFTMDTGIPVNLVTGEGDILIKRLEIEGENSPADLLLTTDVARLYRAKTLGLLQPVSSPVLSEAIPGIYRDGDGYWFGLSLRARVIVYAKDRVDPGQLSSYEDLTDPRWKGRICVRSSSNAYNQSLVASMIAHNGTEATEKWVQDFVSNFARSPSGGDRDQIKAVAVGECDIALVNTYYLGGMLNSNIDAERQAAEKVALYWSTLKDHGTHFNVSGAGVTKSSRHRDEAIELLEYMTGNEVQKWYANQNFEFPVKPGIEPGPTLQAWGDYLADPVRLDQLGQYHDAAVRLMDRAGWK
jgi:iron(III) transport system substrate-binding protein